MGRMMAGPGISQLMEQMAAAGAPLEAILLAVKALEARDHVEAERKGRAAEKKRKERERTRQSQGGGGTVAPMSPDPFPNDTYSNPLPNKPSPGGDGKAAPTELDQVVSAWNSMTVGTALKPIRKLNASRRRSLSARLREHGLEAVLDAVRRIRKSDFCAGRTDRWTGADFEFLISDGKFLKIIEGSYDNRRGAVPEVDPQKWTAERRAEYARRWGAEAKPPGLSAILGRARASVGGKTVGSGDCGR
jgi:hypothetical protein